MVRSYSWTVSHIMVLQNLAAGAAQPAWQVTVTSRILLVVVLYLSRLGLSGGVPRVLSTVVVINALVKFVVLSFLILLVVFVVVIGLIFL